MIEACEVGPGHQGEDIFTKLSGSLLSALGPTEGQTLCSVGLGSLPPAELREGSSGYGALPRHCGASPFAPLRQA